MKELNEIFIVAWIVFGLYMLVFFAAMADLCSGIRKAKLRGEVRSSYGFKRTVDKLARYYNLLIALTVVDCMQMAGIWYLDIFYGYHIPIFPGCNDDRGYWSWDYRGKKHLRESRGQGKKRLPASADAGWRDRQAPD